ncbi:MAG: VCBS repeat-containing protein [Gammaproteobacteria bacterium]|nr:VCBS repeat-containing protein [Gammaproteobacteria bacterium]
MSHDFSLRSLWRPGAALVLLPLLSSCGGYDCGNCSSGYPPIERSAGVVAADFNKDGFADILQLSSVQNGLEPDPAYLKSYLSTAAGAFAAPTQTFDGDDPLFAVAADINGDGLPDVVTASVEDGALAVFFNNGLMPGTLNTPLVLPAPGASQVAVADVNGDGMADLVAADFNVSLFLQTSPGSFANPVSLYAGGANWVAVGDLNGDSKPDVVVTDGTGVHLLINNGGAPAPSFAAPVTVFTQTANMNVSGWNLVAVADVNGDGLNDLVITDPGPTGGAAPTVNVLLQDPANHGHFLAPVSYPVAPASLAQSIIVRDLNGDNRPDIVIGGTDAVSVLIQDPANPGAFLPATNFTAEDANEIAVADVNGDGHLDIVIATGPTRPLVNGVTTAHPGVLLQSATMPGTFAAPTDLP